MKRGAHTYLDTMLTIKLLIAVFHVLILLFGMNLPKLHLSKPSLNPKGF